MNFRPRLSRNFTGIDFGGATFDFGQLQFGESRRLIVQHACGQFVD